MISIKKILCPVDFFAASDRAVNYAAGLALNYDAKIHLLHVVTPAIPTAYEYPLNTVDIVRSMQEASACEMKKLAAKLKAKGVRVETEVKAGDVHDILKRSISTAKPDLIAMGTHGRRGVGRWFMGSVTEWLMRHCPVPVLTLSADDKVTEPRFRRLLVTTDFSEGTTAALAYAFSIAQENQSQVTLLHVINDLVMDPVNKYRESLLAGVNKQLEDLVPADVRNWCEVETQVEVGLPYRRILKILGSEKPDLLVMNIHGKGMLDGALLGSTAERVVRASRCPVLLIPPLKKARVARKSKPRVVRPAA